MNFLDSRLGLFRPHHDSKTTQGVTQSMTVPMPMPTQPAPVSTVIAPAPAPVAVAPVAPSHSNLGVTILNDALAAGMIAISLFVKNPATQQHAASLITAFAPLIGIIESQLGFTANTPAA